VQIIGTAAPAVALKGYDTVSYFRDAGPVKGLPEFQHGWDGVRYHFSSGAVPANAGAGDREWVQGTQG
jgi:hypothetical protein